MRISFLIEMHRGENDFYRRFIIDFFEILFYFDESDKKTK